MPLEGTGTVGAHYPLCGLGSALHALKQRTSQNLCVALNCVSVEKQLCSGHEHPWKKVSLSADACFKCWDKSGQCLPTQLVTKACFSLSKHWAVCSVPGTVSKDKDTMIQILNPQGAKNLLCSSFGLFLCSPPHSVLDYFITGRILYFLNQHSAFPSETYIIWKQVLSEI